VLSVSSWMGQPPAAARRVLVAGLLLAASVILGMGAPASAADAPCSCTRADRGNAASASPGSEATVLPGAPLDRKARKALRRQLRAADLVVSGTISAVDDNPRPESFTVRLSRVYRGEVTTPTLTFEQSPTCPQLDVVTGQQWYVLAQQPQAAGARPQVSQCTGSVVSDQSVRNLVEKELGTGVAAPQPPPPTATFTSVETSGPDRFTRMAAPGAAMVVVGLLGMVVVGRLGRGQHD
jgi:hypothetical protein